MLWEFTEKGLPPALYYKANITTYIRANRYKHTHHGTQHTPKARYKGAGHRHTTPMTTKHPKDEQRSVALSWRRSPRAIHRGEMRRPTAERGLQDDTSKKGTPPPSDPADQVFTRSNPKGVGAPRRSLQGGNDVHGRRHRRPGIGR